MNQLINKLVTRQRTTGRSTISAPDTSGSVYMQHNPFSVNNVQPGAVPFFFEKSHLLSLKIKDDRQFKSYLCDTFQLDDSNTGTWIGLQFLADEFEQQDQCRAQVTGQHGVGKSTLMAALEKTLTTRGYLIQSIALHNGQRALPDNFIDELNNLAALPPRQEAKEKEISKLIFLDGFEQLSIWNRFVFRHLCRKNNIGWLISSHRAVWGIPVLRQLIPSLEQLRQIVSFLTEDQEILFNLEECESLFYLHKGNIRDILFALYDEYEVRWEMLNFHRKLTLADLNSEKQTEKHNDERTFTGR